MAQNYILAAQVQSNKSQNMVWAVYAQGQEESKGYCKSAWAAMKYAFLLKKQTGLYIADECLKALSAEIKRVKALLATEQQKEQQAQLQEVVQEFCDTHSVDNVLAQSAENTPKPEPNPAGATTEVAQPEAQPAKQPRKRTTRKPRAKKAEQKEEQAEAGESQPASSSEVAAVESSEKEESSTEQEDGLAELRELAEYKLDFQMLKQYESLKEKHPDAILLFRKGDWYVTMNDDAKNTAEVLGLTLIRPKNIENGECRAEFPHHSLDVYLPKLIRAGLRVAICDAI